MRRESLKRIEVLESENDKTSNRWVVVSSLSELNELIDPDTGCLIVIKVF